MSNEPKIEYTGGENLNLKNITSEYRHLSFRERAAEITSWLDQQNGKDHHIYMREILSKAENKVIVRDGENGSKEMLMFGSNNYLGLASHPKIEEAVLAAIKKYGTGIGGPPILNGYTQLHKELEERLADLKKQESAVIFSSGYGANAGLIAAIMDKKDLLLYDKFSHASLIDGLRMTNCSHRAFPHNDLNSLEHSLSNAGKEKFADIFIGVEGVYSMDGDTAPLDKLVEIKNKYGALLVIDDAHGTGILGENGGGTSEYYDVCKSVDIVMGTFSKALAVTGGFVAASRDIVQYLRFFSRPYMFSASIPPPLVAAVIAGLDVVANEPERRKELRDNVNYFVEQTANIPEIQLTVKPEAGIVAIRVPENMNAKKAAAWLDKRGIFLNAVEYPAVPLHEQRFRISFMCTHQRDEINYLLHCLKELYISGDCRA